jgi:hypothetical protein
MAGGGQAEKFRTMLWPKIEDAASAIEAMKLAQWVGLLIAIGYVFALVIAFSAGQYPDGAPIEDEEELIGLAFIYIVLIVIALVFWLLARRGQGWAVLTVSVWGVPEAVLKLLGGSGGGVILAILMALFCLSGFRGWLGVRKYGLPGDGKDEAGIAE